MKCCCNVWLLFGCCGLCWCVMEMDLRPDCLIGFERMSVKEVFDVWVKGDRWWDG